MACILLAEDDDSLRPYLERALTKAGHVVTACERGDQALVHLRRSPGLYDVLVTDIVMPELDGITLAKEAAALIRRRGCCSSRASPPWR
jgi:two-component system cell cycle response regulator CpdR